MDKFFGDLLFKIKFWIETLDRRERSIKCFQPVCVFFRTARELRVVLRNRVAYFLHLLAQARKNFHVTFAALDFLIENDAVESFAALREFLGKIEMRAGGESEAINMLLHHVFRFFD